MAAEDGVDRLKLFWDHFFKAETGTYEKSTWLDLFLAEFLIRLNDGANAKELINFCPVSGVVTLVGCELLCGIHRVTSSINTHYSPLARDTLASENTPACVDDPEAEKPEDPRVQSASLFTRNNAQTSEQILRQYLLGGVAWRCLVLLRALGVEGLSCCRQLSSVLIWLFGELSLSRASAPARPSARAAAYAHAGLPRTPIHLLFSQRIWAKQRASSQASKSNSSPEKNSTNIRARPTARESPEGRGRRRVSSHSEHSSESADCNDDLEVFHRSFALRAPPNDHFEYFNSSTRSSNEYTDSYSGSHHSPRKHKPKVDDYMNDKHKEIINSEIGAFEFTLVITDLLRELCRAESGLAGAQGSQISTQCINFALRHLCALQGGAAPPPGEARDVSAIKLALTELLMVSLDKVLVHSDLCAKLINNGILPMLLRILEGIVTNFKKDNDRAKETDKTESENSLESAFGVAYSIIAFFHRLLMRCRTVDNLREFTEQFRLYGECAKGGLLEDCIRMMIRIPVGDETKAVVLIKKLVESIGELIGGMKRVRAEVMHSAACQKHKHKICRRRVAAGVHHHHDVLGEAGRAACCVSLLYGTLAALLADRRAGARAALRGRLLRTMLECGACCCFPPAALVESAVRLALAHAAAAAPALRLLEHAVYGQPGAGPPPPRAADRLPCAVCEPGARRPAAAPRPCRHAATPPERRDARAFLVHYNSLLQPDNPPPVLHATVAHLLRVTPRFRTEMKHELLFNVIYPTFIVAKHRYAMRLDESAFFLTASCLNVFAGLLNTVSFAERFIQKGGLSYVLELVALPEFSKRCCSILEIAIVVEIYKLTRENAGMTHHGETGSLPSVRMLFRSLAEMSARCLEIYRLKLPADAFAALADVTEERAALAGPAGAAGAGGGAELSPPQTMEHGGARADTTVEHAIEDHLDVLKNVWTFWRTCGGLCAHSAVFRGYLAREAALLDSYALLKVVLRHLCAADCGAQELRILIKLVEALLTVQLAVADVTGNRSKETSCALVRAALVSGGAGARAPGGVLRPLCEALVRVAAAEPGRRHALPSLAHAKVPPLVCASGSSSGECSSSEDSAPALYASEHSDPPQRQDEGYEADVEIGKFDLLPPHKNKKMSSTLSSINTLSDQAIVPDTLSLECAEYAKNGDLTHPELCIIVVDILTQLIDKVVSSKTKEATAIRAAAALARACCARLSSAGAALGAGPGAAPLLHRLLAAPAAHALLTARDRPLDELQRSVLELVSVLGSWSIGPSELTLLLRIVTSPHAPLAASLHTLASLVHPHHHTPDCILAFPVSVTHTGDNTVNSLSEEFVHMTLHGVSSQSHAAEASARRLHAAHTQHGISSIWSRGAVRCGVEGAGWAPWNSGFALVVWLRPDSHELASEPAGSDAEWDGAAAGARAAPQCAHVLAIGHDSLMLEMWLDSYAAELLFRLTRPELSRNLIISEGRVSTQHGTRNMLKEWSCIALNVQERVHKKNMFIQVTVFINGYECETLSLPITGILVRKVTPTHVVVGHAAQGTAPAQGTVCGYHLAGVSVYRCPALDVARALHLTAHGANHHCMVRCEAPNYPSVLTPEVLDSNIDWDQVYEMSGSSLRELHENLLLTFSASSPAIMNLYHQTAPLPAVFSGRVTAAGQSPGGASIPEALWVWWGAAPLPLRHRGLATALALLQPVDILLFLYARVVELEGSAQEQAQALGVLLAACAHDDALYAAFHSGAAADMLLTVFSSTKCALHPHLLKVILESACSAAVLRISGSAVSVTSHSDAAVLEPALLVLLAKAAAKFDATKEFTWEEDSGPGGQGTLWALTLRCLRVLVRPGHPRRAFNHYQLARVDLMHHLLLACKERFLNSDTGPMSWQASDSFVSLLRGLSGDPPRLHRLTTLCDFLLLMHQASDTFVTHSRANFYFLLTSETQEMSEYNTLLRKKSSKRTKRRQDRPSNSSEEISTDNSLNTPGNMDENRDDSEKVDTEFSAPNKEMKSLINEQIKEGRKHYVSSTSDNSDTTPEVAEGSESEGKAAETEEQRTGAGGDLTEYIVVDADDVCHTTVEMYSSGIYHQEGRVRSGAAPGWAGSAALLLLLRDSLALLPPHDLDQAVMGAIQSEVIVVLANQRCAAVRAGVVRVLAALQRRATADFHRRLHSVYYYIHLANQISLYEGSWELAMACAALITKCDVTLEDQLDDDIWVDVTEESLSRSPPLLALLPCCLHDPPLALAILKIMQRIVEKASLKLLGELYLVEVLVRTVRALGLRREGGSEGERDETLEAVYRVLTAVALKALPAQHSLQTVVDIHHMLSYIEQSAGDAAGVVSAALDAQAVLFIAQLDYLEERLHTSYNDQKTGNYFANVLTSAVSLGSGGGLRGELGGRLGGVASRAVSFLLPLPAAEPLPARLQALLERLLTLLSAGVSCGSERPKWWVGGGSECGAALQELVTWALGGAGAGPAALRALYPHRVPSPHDPHTMRKLAVYLVSLLQRVHGAAEAGGARLEYAITDWARAWALALQASLAARLPPDSLALEAAACRAADAVRWARQAERARLHRARVVYRNEGTSARVAEAAMCITRAAVEAQNAERKRFMEHLRRAGAAAAAAAAAWDDLRTAHTHEQGVFHDPASYPAAWALDPTEGAGRVRVRLRRAALRIHPKFLKPEHRHKAECNMAPPPLASVVEGGARGGVVARLHLHETVAYMARAVCVTTAADTPGELLLSDRCIHFVPDEVSPAPAPPSRRKLGPPVAEARAGAQSWPLERVTRVEPRRWCLQEVAVELFLSTGHAHLVAFADVAERGAFLKALGQCHLPYKMEADSLSEAMSQWRSGSITNWEYLMRLNGLGGRSYNDLMQYPVLPFILADYSSRVLDLAAPASFRDLSRPVAVQNKAREQHYINTYNDLKAARREGSSPLLSSQPHHYASLYSNSGGVLHYLLRVPPFTELFLNYQDNNFDMPDRTFHSLATTWRLITQDSHTDVKELIPELFYLPELFRNNEGLNFGTRQCGAPIDEVELPAWAADARLFTLAHRQALEARAVTEALPAWIDLVFGYKQTGQAAVDAINVFPACTYYGFDPGALEDAGDRVAAAAMVRTYGQAPRRLLRAPHPHAARDLHAAPAADTSTSVFGGVQGARWGRYCGSPELGAPAACARRTCAGAAAVLAAPAPRAAVAAARDTLPLALYGDTSSNQSGTQPPLGLVSWGHSDSIVRLKRRQHAAPDLLLLVPPRDQITKVAAASISCNQSYPLFLGHASGRILSVRVRTYGAGAARLRVRTRVLLAHAAPVADMHVCVPAALLASASCDGRIVLWDLNSLTYIRTLPNRDMLPVSLVTISATLSDVATVHDTAAAPNGTVPNGTNGTVPSGTNGSVPTGTNGSVPNGTTPNGGSVDADAANDYEKDVYKYKSLIRVHTCNGVFVGSVKVLEEVSSICYSHAAEGVSVNSIAAGLRSGAVRLYCSWDLRPTLYVAPDTRAPLVSLTYSCDSSLLFGCYAGGAVCAWEAPAAARPAPVRILPANALY